MNNVWKWPVLALLVVVLGAFLAAELMHQSEWLSRVPPPSDANPNLVADVAPEQTKTLYRAAFTAWAALVLMLPAFGFVWTRNRGAWAPWQAWWTVSYVAFAIHMFWAMAIYFGGDVTAMQSSTRVSAFWPGVILLVWCGVDVLLSFVTREGALIRIQRVIVHLLAFVLMVGGSLVKGETIWIQALGALLLVTALGAGVRSIKRKG